MERYINRDISWLLFNQRVLDQANKPTSTLTERFRFLSISASNLDEFFMIRIGTLYNYFSYKKRRHQAPKKSKIALKRTLLQQTQVFYQEQQKCYLKKVLPALSKSHARIIKNLNLLNEENKKKVHRYFKETLFPLLTPRTLDLACEYPYPIILNQVLTFVIKTENTSETEQPSSKVTLLQIPHNFPRFYTLTEKKIKTYFIPIEEIIRQYLSDFFKNQVIASITLLRATRNGDFYLEDPEELEDGFVAELKRKLKNRTIGEIVRLEVEENYDNALVHSLKQRWQLDDKNLFVTQNKALMVLSNLDQLLYHDIFKSILFTPPTPIPPITKSLVEKDVNLFHYLKQQDLLLHHPYQSFSWVLKLLRQAAEDVNVLAIKMTLYRLAKPSRVIHWLLQAAKNGKHVVVLVELKARFDEENNIRQAKILQDAGCLVIYSESPIKVHSKLLIIIKKEKDTTICYTHLSSGNYDEETAKLYTDVSLMTAKPSYTAEVLDFFNVITGHASLKKYQHLLTAPENMRKNLIELIDNEIKNAEDNLPSGIIIKVNAIEDKEFIDALYKASQAGVNISLIVRGICCLVPQAKGLSEHINVRSIIGQLLEHTRIFYFHQQGNPAIYAGSADIMCRSFERRFELLYKIEQPDLKQQIIYILSANLKDNRNAYKMDAYGNYHPIQVNKSKTSEAPFKMQREFFYTTFRKTKQAQLLLPSFTPEHHST